MIAAGLAAVALASCSSAGAVDESELRAEAQSRGGGVTAGLIADALDEISEESGVDPLRLLGVTASLGQVQVVVPSPDGTAAETWRYGTSGLLGGRGLEGPDRTGAASGASFTAAEAGLDGLDAALDGARRATGRVDGWVQSLTVTRPSSDVAPLTTVVLVDAAGQEQVVLGPDGEVVGEGPR